MSKRTMPTNCGFDQPGPADRPRQPAYRPQGVKYPTPTEAFQIIGEPTRHWSYWLPWSKQETWVLRYDKPDGSRKFRVISQYKGGWYIDQLPPVPFHLYLREKLVEAETIYVCEGERTTSYAYELGLTGTTSLGGPFQARLSDWSPLEDKHVVVLRDADDKGLKYAEEVAQLALAAGARSAKIVTLPGLNEGEGLVEWIGGRHKTEGPDAVRAELEALALAAPLVERQTSPVAGREPKIPQAELRCFSQVAPQPQEWVWANVVPQAALTLITGEPGVGKSLLTIEVAAAVSRGDGGPHGQSQEVPGTQGVPGAVILISAEDDPAKTIRPRLDAAAADVSLVYAWNNLGGRANEDENKRPVNGQFNPPDDDVTLLERELQSLQSAGIAVRLVVIDPLRSFAAADRPVDASQLAMRLAELASRAGTAILIVADSPSSRIGGTARSSPVVGAFATVARSVWMIARDLNDPQRRLVRPIKTNLCGPQPGLAYSIQNQAVRWEDNPVPLTSDQLVAQTLEQQRSPLAEEDGSELSRVCQWLRDQLQGGRVLSTVIQQYAADNQITQITLRRAFHQLGCQSGIDKQSGKWCWCLAGPSTSSVAVENQVAQAVSSTGPVA